MTLAVRSAEELMAHHPLLLALPAFVPALIVVGVVVHIAVKDRREERAEAESMMRDIEDFKKEDDP